MKRFTVRRWAQSRKWLAGWMAGLAGIGLLGLSFLTIGRTRGAVQPPARNSVGPPMALHGVRSFLYHDQHLQLRASAESLSITHPRILGPFRIGFLRSVSARKLTIESFDRDGTNSGDRAPSSDIAGAMVALAPQALRKGVAELGIKDLKVIHHQGERAVVTLEADECHSAMTDAALVCRDGWLLNGGTAVEFQEASYDGSEWKVVEARDARRTR